MLKTNEGLLETRNAGGRIWLTHQAVSRTRRMTSLHNEHTKTILEKQRNAIQKEISHSEISNERARKPVAKKLSELQSYKASLDQHRKSCTQSGIPRAERLYGVYQGHTSNDLRPLMEKIIAWNDPQAKKKRVIQRQLTSGMRNGSIIDLTEAKVKFDQLLNRPFPNAVVQKDRKEACLRLPPVVVSKAMIKRRNTKERKALVNLLFLNRSHSTL
ncbi:hypothetical protein CAPTEDRAFT_218237 [Capitella teleta]|uniref:Uncharacterized protein n=1 Tax=Capitella teleta TaxID=283909 RepID=R7VB41_CAPTE|nr:hypothetical protein CAPTEDRAFT_218237 [Capitella teleta]|eukprot:ELU13541.1 hypothetical protein CAPTEDRAFT_218237 [Capitella teleta]